jgi:hypothetical protein
MTDRAKKRLVAEQEGDFLLAFYGKSSPTRLDRRASAITAGYTNRMALWNANRLLKKFADKGFRDCVEAIGVSNPALAVAFKETLEGAEGKDALAALRLALANRGEQTDSSSIQKNLTVNQPVMVIVGATDERMRALRSGRAPQFTDDRAAELPPAADEDLILEVEPTAAAPEPAPEAVQSKPATPIVEDARRQTADDYNGNNLRELLKRK